MLTILWRVGALVRGQDDRGLAGNLPVFFRLERRCTATAITRISLDEHVSHCIPSERGKQRLRNGTQSQGET